MAIFWETARHYEIRCGKKLRHDAPVVGFHEGYECYSDIESYSDAKRWARRIVIVDAEHGSPPDDYNKEYEDEE